MLWSGNHIGHGSKIFDHTYVASHVVISGHCQIGRRCFLGVNSTIRDFVEIGDDVLVGMRGLVTRNIKSADLSCMRTLVQFCPQMIEKREQ